MIEKPTTIIAAIFDPHFGSNTAPAPEKFEVHTARPNETVTQTANKIQNDLREKWDDYWQYVFNLAGITPTHRKHRLVVINGGDVMDGDHHGTYQIIREPQDQFVIANTMMGEAHKQADVRVGIIGTPAHAGQEGNSEYNFYQANNYQHIGQQLSVEIDGVLFDLAHHVSGSKRQSNSSAARVAADVALSYYQAGKRAPNYVLRGHVHMLDDSGYRVRGTRCIFAPSWQLRTTYGYRVANTGLSDIGGLVFNCGAVDLSHARYDFPSDREVIRI